MGPLCRLSTSCVKAYAGKGMQRDARGCNGMQRDATGCNGMQRDDGMLYLPGLPGLSSKKSPWGIFKYAAEMKVPGICDE